MNLIDNFLYDLWNIYLQPVHFGLRVEVPGVRGRGHRLLAHLALVHVPRGLVEVRQGDRAGEVAQEARLPDLLMGGRGVRLVSSDADVHVNLARQGSFIPVAKRAGQWMVLT